MTSPRAFMARSTSERTASGVRPSSRAARAPRRDARARDRDSACRALVSISPRGVPSSGKSRAMAASRASRPCPSRAERDSTVPSSASREAGSHCRGRSALFCTAITRGTARAIRMTSRSSSVRGREPSSTSRASSASAAARRARSTPRRSTGSEASRIPAVSMSRSRTPPAVAFSSTVSRVVPATSVTMARS